jgi:hypothetical protein
MQVQHPVQVIQAVHLVLVPVQEARAHHPVQVHLPVQRAQQHLPVQKAQTRHPFQQVPVRKQILVLRQKEFLNLIAVVDREVKRIIQALVQEAH